jgi:hypothetical protein
VGKERGEEEEAADTSMGRGREGTFELGFFLFFFLPRSWDPRTSLGSGLEVIVELLSGGRHPTCWKSLFLHWADIVEKVQRG